MEHNRPELDRSTRRLVNRATLADIQVGETVRLICPNRAGANGRLVRVTEQGFMTTVRYVDDGWKAQFPNTYRVDMLSD